MVLKSEAIASQHYYEPDTKEIGFKMAYVLHEAGGQLTTQRLVDILADHFQISVLWEYDDSRESILYQKWHRAVRHSIHKMKTWGFIERAKTGGDSYPVLTKSGHQLGDWARRFYNQEDIDLPDWVRKFLSPLQKRIGRFLKGISSGSKPNGIELCRWVDFCYRSKQYDKTSGLFCAVLKDRVPEDIYIKAERQARIGQIKLAEEEDLKLSKFFLRVLEKQFVEITEKHSGGYLDQFKIGFFYLLYEAMERTMGEKLYSEQIDMLEEWRHGVDEIAAHHDWLKEELLKKATEEFNKYPQRKDKK